MTASSLPAADSLQVDRIILREIRLELREPFRISSGVLPYRRIALLEFFDATGARTWSECVAFQLPNYTSETIDTAWLAIREWLAPRVLGRRFAGPEEVHSVLAQNIRGNNMAKAAIEMGCWALTAALRQTSLSAVLGGTRDRVATGISLGIQDRPEHLVARAEAAVAEGYRKIKVKIQPGQDIEYVRAVRTALGSTIDMGDPSRGPDRRAGGRDDQGGLPGWRDGGDGPPAPTRGARPSGTPPSNTRGRDRTGRRSQTGGYSADRS